MCWVHMAWKTSVNTRSLMQAFKDHAAPIPVEHTHSGGKGLFSESYNFI